jgi:anti-anti-sigma factor
MIFLREEQGSGGVWILYVQGSLRVPLNPDLRHTVQILLRRGAQRILVNLAGVWDVDAGGVGELVRVYNVAMRSQADVRIAETTPWVRELLNRAGLLELLSADAQRRLKAPARAKPIHAPMNSTRSARDSNGRRRSDRL